MGLKFAIKGIGLLLIFCWSLLEMAQAQQTVLDQFSSVAYNNNNGTQNFSTNWTETNDDTAANAGRILITGNQLQVGSTTLATAPGVSIQRSANLGTTPGVAFLSFTISQTRVDAVADDSVVLEISSGGPFVTLDTFSSAGTGSKSYSVSSYISSNTTIRFKIENPLEANEFFSVDNVQIAFAYDLGDAPDTASGTGMGNYPTTLSDGGAVHQIVAGLALGTIVEADSGLLQNAAANADDINGTDDEDGVISFSHLPTTATTYSVDVTVTNNSGQDAYLVGYLDRNRNGVFTNSGEKSATVIVPSSTTNPRIFTVTFSSLTSLSAGTTYMRFRLSNTQTQAESSVGVSTSGEVEDYRIGIGVDYGDAPDAAPGTSSGNYQATAADGGPAHSILSGLSLGTTIDADNGTLQNTTASADGADEDGIASFAPLLVADTSYSVSVSVSNSVEVPAYLVGYIDFNRDGDFDDPGERSSTITVPSDTSNPRTFSVNFSGLTGGVVGTSYARFRLSTVQSQAESSVGLSHGGEVEDYQVEVSTLASVSGKVFRDQDLSDSFGAGDSGVANITVTVYRDDGDGLFEPGTGDGVGLTAVTDTDGDYSIPSASTGNIWVAVDVTDNDLPSGYLPGERTAHYVYLSSSGSSHDFPYDPPGAGFSSCPAQAFLFQDTPTRAIIVDLVTGTFSYPPGGTMPYQVNGIAYNIQDNYIYGAIGSSPDGTITRVDSSYRATRIGPVVGLPAASIFVGDTDDNYNYYLFRNGVIYIVDLDPSSATYLRASTVTTTSTSIADWAFNVLDGKLYAIDNNTGDLYRFDPGTGMRELLGYTGIPGSAATFGAAYNDPNGFLYFSNNTDGIIYRIDARNPASVNPTAVFFSNGPASSSNDGARCLNAPIEIDFADAPDSYGTTIANGGARHIISGLGANRIGSLLDQESDGQPTPDADGDDSNNFTDEEGVTLGGSSLQNQTLNAGITRTLDITTSGSGVLSAWIDFNRDGDFLDAGERIATDVMPSGGTITLPVTVPANASIGVSYARFRFSTTIGVGPTGAAADGEVEDYKINLYAEIDLELSKSVDLSAPQPGDIVTYTITVDNQGSFAATGVSVEDNLPAELLLIQTSGCAEDLVGIPTCTLGTIGAGASKSYTIEAQVLNTTALGTVITNTAEVATADQPDVDSTPGNATAEDDLDSVDMTVSGLVLEKWVCNLTEIGICTYPADYSDNVVGKPGDVMEYRINYTRVGPAIFSVEMADDVPLGTTLEQNVYDAALDKEVMLGCPDGSVVYLERGLVSTISFVLATECVLSTATNPLTLAVEEALLEGESGYFMFRAKIQ